MSADPFIQAPGQWMNYDRYAYVMNNPLIYYDPTGHKWDWNWINPVYWMSEGMQWLNDNTTGLREKMVDIGIPNFNVEHNIEVNLSGNNPSTYQPPSANTINGYSLPSGSDFYSQLTPGRAITDMLIMPSLSLNYQMHGVSVDMRSGSLMFDDKSTAYDYMWNKSFNNEFGNFGPVREVSGFQLQSGKVMVMPYYANKINKAFNNYQETRGNWQEVKFNNQWHLISTHIHTHPRLAAQKDNPIGLSGDDLDVQRGFGKPILIIYDRAIYSIDGTYNYEKDIWNFEELMIW